MVSRRLDPHRHLLKMEFHSFMNILDNAVYTILSFTQFLSFLTGVVQQEFIRIPGFLGNNYCLWKDVSECLHEISEKLQIPCTDCMSKVPYFIIFNSYLQINNYDKNRGNVK